MTQVAIDRQLTNGRLNKIHVEDRSVHDWYRFVLSFPPHLVRTYIERFGIDETQHVLDPFCGTGTVAVECKKQGIPSVSLEAHPFAHFASTVKIDWNLDPEGLIAHARRVKEEALDILGNQGISDIPPKQGPQEMQAQLKVLSPQAEKLLLRGSISPLPLHKTLVLLECLEHRQVASYYRHELLALSRALVDTISNVHFGPEIGVGPIKPDAKVIAPWFANVTAMAEDLYGLDGPTETAIVHHADARHISDVLEPESIDAVITSPPYPNEKDYTRTTRLELVLLGFVTNRTQLRELKQGLLRSNTKGVYKDDDDDQLVVNQEAVQRFAADIEAQRIKLGKTSGFERLYARVTKLYFGGMAQHLADLRIVLRPGAQLAYVVGDQASFLRVLIRTGQTLAEIAQSLGYEVVGIELFRTRLATTTGMQLPEEVVLLRWPGFNH